MKKPSLLPIFLIVVVDVLGLTIVLPLLPFYAEHYGASPTVVGMLAASYAFFQLISGPILGDISDRIGRKPMLLVSQLGTFAGFLVLAYANSLWMVFVSRIMDGITAGNLSVAQAYISDVTSPQERTKSFALIGIAFGLGFLIGPVFSGYLSQFGYSYPIFAAAGLSLTSILATTFLLPWGSPSRAEGDAAQSGRKLNIFNWNLYFSFFRRPELSPLLIEFFLFIFSFSLFISGFALFAERRYEIHGAPFGPREVGYVFGYTGFLGIILQGGLIGRLVKRFGEARLAVVSFVCVTTAFVLLSLSHDTQSLLVAMTVSCCGTGTLRPVLTSMVSQRVGPREQGLLMGLLQSVNSVAQIVAPVVSGLLIGASFLSGWALLGAVFGAAGLLLSKMNEPRYSSQKAT